MGLFTTSKNVEIIEEKKQEIKGKLYCIDFENTQDSGIIGISKLKENDEVVIFYGSNNNSISFVSHEMIVLANCQVTINKCDKSAKNYLDFQLVSYLGYRLGKEKFESTVIVSRDQGYEAVVDFFKGQGIEMSLQPAIDPEYVVAAPIKKKEKPKSEKPKVEKVKVEKPKEKSQDKKTEKNQKVNSLPDSFKKRIRNAVKEEELKPTQYTIIYTTMLRCKSIEEYEKNIKRRMADKGDSVISKTGNIFTEYLARVEKDK